MKCWLPFNFRAVSPLKKKTKIFFPVTTVQGHSYESESFGAVRISYCWRRFQFYFYPYHRASVYHKPSLVNCCFRSNCRFSPQGYYAVWCEAVSLSNEYSAVRTYSGTKRSYWELQPVHQCPRIRNRRSLKSHCKENGTGIMY